MTTQCDKWCVVSNSQQPSRYLGLERNLVRKPRAETALHVALAQTRHPAEKTEGNQGLARDQGSGFFVRLEGRSQNTSCSAKSAMRVFTTKGAGWYRPADGA